MYAAYLENVDFSISHEYECIENQIYIMVTIVWKVLLVSYVAKRSRWSAQQGKPSHQEVWSNFS